MKINKIVYLKKMSIVIISLLLLIFLIISCDTKKCKTCEQWGEYNDSLFLMDRDFFVGKYQQELNGYDFLHDEYGNFRYDSNGKYINIPYILKNCKDIYCN